MVKSVSAACLKSFGVLLFLFVSFASAQVPNQIQKLCGDLTSSNRLLAKSAGYDLDDICKQVKSFSGSNESREVNVEPIEQKVRRKTVSSVNANDVSGELLENYIEEKKLPIAVAPIAVSGVGSPTASELKPFGYDLFANVPNTFAPADDIPVSSDYVLGPGDTLNILFYGKLNDSFSLTINREGFVDFPELGPISIAGLTYGEAKDILQSRISAQIVGTNASISIGSLRSMQVFVLGEAFRPGSYTVSSFSTLTHALIVSGGISGIGSLRNIQLKRKGKIIAKMDLYDLLLNGDISDDIRLQASDVIYIPVVGNLVSISGQVLRPAIYELVGNEDVRDLLRLAGGTGPKAYTSSSVIERIKDNDFVTVIDIDLSRDSDLSIPLKNGDHIRVSSIISEARSVAEIKGFLYHPKRVTFSEGMRVSDLLVSIAEKKPGLDLDYAIIERKNLATGHLSAIAVNLRASFNKSKSPEDIILNDRDKLHIFGIEGDRGQQLNELLAALEAQKKDFPEIAEVIGSRLPGRFPITEGMKLSDLLLSAGGIVSGYSDLENALLVREHEENKGEISVVLVDLIKIVDDNSSPTNLVVKPKDKLFIFSYDEDRSVTLSAVTAKLIRQAKLDKPSKTLKISGSVMYPGVYPFFDNMSLQDLLEISGGLNFEAYKSEAEITRLDMSDDQQATREVIISSLNFKDQLLIPGDEVSIREVPNFKEKNAVVLKGEFRFPGQYFIQRGESLTSIITRTGGFTEDAYTQGSIFTRQSLREREQAEIDRLRNELESNLRLPDQDMLSSNNTSNQIIENAVESLESITATGRLVIPLGKILAGEADDIILKDGDTFMVPKFSQEVTVIGEVVRPASFQFNSDYHTNDYISRSGGFTDRSNKRAIYVVKANGEIIRGTNWFSFPTKRDRIGPGDTIVVPVAYERSLVRNLPIITSVSRIMYELAIASAAVRSFNSD